MKLAVFGDSFVEGLIGSYPIYNTMEERKEINFANQMLKLNGVIKEVDNLGLRGNANQKIAHDCYKYLNTHNHKDLCVIVVWSELSRQAWYDQREDVYWCDGNAELLTKEEPIFIKDSMMLLLHHMLKNKGIPHLFCDSFEKYDSPNLNLTNLPYVKSPLTLLAGHLAPCLHPSESGHKNIAKTLNKFLLKEIDKYKKAAIINV